MPAPDQSLFIVMKDYGRLGFEGVTYPETTRASLVDDIRTGQIDGKIAYIIESNPVEGWSKDCTDDIMEAVAEAVARAA